jgi:phosphoribosylanthranilate isomerase
MEIKICGITNLDDAMHAAQCGADAIGFILYNKSPRYVTPETVKHISNNLPHAVARIGVFVNHDIQEVKDIYDVCKLDLIQLHGDEPPEYCGHFPASLLIKAFAPRSEEDSNIIREYPVKAILIDARTAELYGGTGEKSNWEVALRLKELYPLILSGGLNTDNILEAIETVSPHAVDVNSGVELSPRKKDPDKVSNIITMVHAVRNKSPIRLFIK